MPYSPRLRAELSDAFDAYLWILREVDTRIKSFLGRNTPGWRRTFFDSYHHLVWSIEVFALFPRFPATQIAFSSIMDPYPGVQHHREPGHDPPGLLGGQERASRFQPPPGSPASSQQRSEASGAVSDPTTPKKGIGAKIRAVGSGIAAVVGAISPRSQKTRPESGRRSASPLSGEVRHSRRLPPPRTIPESPTRPRQRHERAVRQDDLFDEYPTLQRAQELNFARPGRQGFYPAPGTRAFELRAHTSPLRAGEDAFERADVSPAHWRRDLAPTRSPASPHSPALPSLALHAQSVQQLEYTDLHAQEHSQSPQLAQYAPQDVVARTGAPSHTLLASQPAQHAAIASATAQEPAAALPSPIPHSGAFPAHSLSPSRAQAPAQPPAFVEQSGSMSYTSAHGGAPPGLLHHAGLPGFAGSAQFHSSQLPAFAPHSTAPPGPAFPHTTPHHVGHMPMVAPVPQVAPFASDFALQQLEFAGQSKDTWDAPASSDAQLPSNHASPRPVLSGYDIPASPSTIPIVRASPHAAFAAQQRSEVAHAQNHPIPPPLRFEAQSSAPQEVTPVDAARDDGASSVHSHSPSKFSYSAPEPVAVLPAQPVLQSGPVRSNSASRPAPYGETMSVHAEGDRDEDMVSERRSGLVLKSGWSVARTVQEIKSALNWVYLASEEINLLVWNTPDLTCAEHAADFEAASMLAEAAKSLAMSAQPGKAKSLLECLGAPEPELLYDLFQNVEHIKLRVDGMAGFPTSAQTAPPSSTPAPPAHTGATPANPNSYAGRAAKKAGASKASPAAPTAPAPKAPPAPPTDPRARHHPARLVLTVRATPALTAHVRDNARLLRETVNKSLSGLKAQRAPHKPLSISAVQTSGSGNLVVLAAEGLTSEDLLPHAASIARDILLDSDDYVAAACDEPWHQVLVNGVPTKTYGVEGLPTPAEIYEDIVSFTAHKYNWATMPRWLGDASGKPKGSVVLSFKSAADAAHAVAHSVIVFGISCAVRHFEEIPRLRVCERCCGTDHSTRICEKEIRCGVCGSNEHITKEHDCADISCEFYKNHPAHGTHCEHTKLKCPHCGGEHAVRDSQCKVWQQRRNALRKPKHDAAKTGGQVRRTKSRAALGPKSGKASGANAVPQGARRGADAPPAPPAPAGDASTSTAPSAPPASA